ncbi:hypothetical protein H4R35_002842 [Dimargaris xerosporica]|nr:hypothetical protein H4R35_002842 [Dimargaris xerosporica]
MILWRTHFTFGLAAVGLGWLSQTNSVPASLGSASDQGPLLACPEEIIQRCFGYLSWAERAKLLPVCNAVYQLNSDITLLPSEKMKKICYKLAADGFPSNAALAAKLITKRPTDETRDVLAPYFYHLKSLSSVMDPNNLAPMAMVSNRELKQQLSLLSMLQGPPSAWGTAVSKVAAALDAHVRTAEASDMFEWMSVRYWVWRDILKAAIYHDHVEVVQLADQHLWSAYEKWLNALHTTYPEIRHTTRMSDIIWEGLEEEGWKHIQGSMAVMMEGQDVQLMSPLSYVKQEHRVLFWMWAMELGRDSISQQLAPKDLNATSGRMLTTVACQLKLHQACTYLSEMLQFQPKTALSLDRMSLLDQIRFVPDHVMAFNPQDVTEVMVVRTIAPEKPHGASS